MSSRPDLGPKPLLGYTASILARSMFQPDETVSAAHYNSLLGVAKRLAGSVLSQDETKGQD